MNFFENKWFFLFSTVFQPRTLPMYRLYFEDMFLPFCKREKLLSNERNNNFLYDYEIWVRNRFE